jgi:hypothetical protein
MERLLRIFKVLAIEICHSDELQKLLESRPMRQSKRYHILKLIFLFSYFLINSYMPIKTMHTIKDVLVNDKDLVSHLDDRQF